MIDLMQWRASVGTWHCVTCCHKSRRSNRVLHHGEELHSAGEWWIGSLRLLGVVLAEIVKLSYSFVIKLILLLLLCGDVETNPGPITIELTSNKAVNILHRSGFNIRDKWNSLAGALGVSMTIRKSLQEEAKTVETTQEYQFILEKALVWWIENTTQPSWEILLSAVEECADDKVVEDKMREILNTSDDSPRITKASISEKTLSLYDSQAQLGCESEELTPFLVLKHHFSEILDLVPDPDRLANDMSTVDLITNVVRDDVLTTTGLSRYGKASKLLNEAQKSLKFNNNPETLILLCKVLNNQRSPLITTICNNMLKKFGSLPDKPLNQELTHTSMSIFCKELCDVIYNIHELDVAENKFGQLGLVQGDEEIEGHFHISKGIKNAWIMLRDKADNITNASKEMDIQDVLKQDDDNSPIKVIVDGPPGVGKTTLCKKLCNMWAKNELNYCSFELVLLLPLRDEKVSSAVGMCDLLSFFHSNEVVCEGVSKQIKEGNGRGLLLIFDGWDEFDRKERSFVLDIIQRKQLHSCSIMITSRTFASGNLLKITNIRHVEVLGFEKKEILSYIRKNLTDKKKVELLITDLKIRKDVLSMCYIPFVCSMLLTVYHQCEYVLPHTLTKLYREFIRHSVNQSKKNGLFDPDIESLNELSKDSRHEMKTAFDEICYFAYKNLQTQCNTFSRDQIHSRELSHSSEYRHFDFIKSYKIAGASKYQFFHLTIQEFLAAWWITQQDNCQVLFAKHFDDTHFRMTITFVAGLTELKDDSYREYFSKEVQVHCVKKPMFGFQSRQYSLFHQNQQVLCEHITGGFSKYPDNNSMAVFRHMYIAGDYSEYFHFKGCDTDTVRLLHLLYESQNTELCQLLASFIKHSSICVRRVYSSQFDLLCLSFFLTNSKKSWNHFDLSVKDYYCSRVTQNFMVHSRHHFTVLNPQKFIDEISKGSKFTGITAKCDIQSVSSLVKICHSSFCQSLLEFYFHINVYSVDEMLTVFKEVFKLPQLTILHVDLHPFKTNKGHYKWEDDIDRHTLQEMEKEICTNSNIKELRVDIHRIKSSSHGYSIIIQKMNRFIHTFVAGVGQNGTIQFFTFNLERCTTSSLFYEPILEKNKTLRAFKLNLNMDHLVIPPSMYTTKINKSLTALDIDSSTVYDIITFPTETLSHDFEIPRNSTNLKSLVLYTPPVSLSILLDSNPFLQHLDITLDKAESCNKLLNILCDNRSIVALKIRLDEGRLVSDEVGKSLQLMLSSNQTLQCLEFTRCSTIASSSVLMKFLAAGLRQNHTLQELDVNFKFSKDDNLKDFFEATTNLKALKMTLQGSQLALYYYEQIVPHVTNMLKRNQQMNILDFSLLDNQYYLKKMFEDIPVPVVIVQQFWETVLLHPSLCYIELSTMGDLRILNDMKKPLIIQREQKKLGPPPLIDIL